LTSFPDAGLIPIWRNSSASVRSAGFRLANDGRCFVGHFEGAPILPGVAHLALALTTSQPEGETGRPLAGLRDVRLRRALHPGDEVEVVLTEIAETASMRFEIRCRGELASSGLLIFESGSDVAAP
jgi:3-hydroxymyristoyl/3-hydroxydecanoyl-(acyl carrier protein) dehydratase